MIIIFGGAFNPVHDEHVNMIKYLLDRKEVEKVVVLPSFNPPHKSCPTSYSQRREMLQLALRGIDRIEICDYENTDNKKHYTVETLPYLKNIYKDIAFVIGGDSLEALDKWKNPQEIIKICPLYVFTRGQSEGFDKALEYWRRKGADIVVCDYHPDDVSSTLIRYNIMLGVYDDINPDVAEYIRENKLYDSFRSILDKLKESLIPKTYEHSLRTAKYALRLNYKLALGLDYDKVFLAGVLHDCAKNMCAEPHDTQGVPSDSIGSPVEHQFLGAIVAKSEYGIEDKDVLNAIKYHTTGKKEMSLLEKLIFCSDMLEEKRDFEGVEELRKSIEKSLDEGYRDCVLHQYAYLSARGGEIYPLTLQAVEGVK